MKINLPFGFSIEDPNTTIPTGAVMDYFGTSAPEGWTLVTA